MAGCTAIGVYVVGLVVQVSGVRGWVGRCREGSVPGWVSGWGGGGGGCTGVSVVVDKWGYLGISGVGCGEGVSGPFVRGTFALEMRKHGTPLWVPKYPTPRYGGIFVRRAATRGVTGADGRGAGPGDPRMLSREHSGGGS